MCLSSSLQEKEHETWALKRLLNFPEKNQPFINLLAYICEHVLLRCCSSTSLTVFTLLSSCPHPSQTPMITLKKTTKAQKQFFQIDAYSAVAHFTSQVSSPSHLIEVIKGRLAAKLALAVLSQDCSAVLYFPQQQLDSPVVYRTLI